jgi:hypothetical protein
MQADPQKSHDPHLLALDPDADQLEIFIDALFRHVGRGYASLRCFPDSGNGGPAIIRAVKFDGRNLHPLIRDAVEVARIAANARDRMVFAPPIAVFNNTRYAREEDLVEGPVISVECDRHPQQALDKLQGLIGPPTVVVASGGVWIDPTTGEVHDKLHLHYRLSRPARGKDQLDELKAARSAACEFVGGDRTTNSVVHPLRWPGSWHRKAEPRLCRIVAVNADVELDAGWVLSSLPSKPKPPPVRYSPPRRFPGQVNSRGAIGRVEKLARDLAGRAPETGRNIALYKGTHRVIDMLRDGSLDHAGAAQAIAVLRAAAVHSGLDERGAANTIQSALRKRGAA